MKNPKSALALLIICMTAAVKAQRMPISPGNDLFTSESLIRGVSATPAECNKIEGAVWPDAGAFGAECIRTWTHGAVSNAASQPWLVYLPPDQLSFDLPAPGYTGLRPARIATLTEQMQQRLGVPFIFVARPGTFGSSGFHKDRRREAEARLVSAALDALKHRHGIRNFVLAGLSGGGHTVASLLGWRSDIVCAVAGSAVSSPRMRWKLMGQASDLTGHVDSYEPIDHLSRERMHPQLRVFILGDPQDTVVPWSTQLPLGTRLQEIGVSAYVVNAEGSDPQHHLLSETTRVVGAACARGESTKDILELVKGLKG